ncbi:MAG: c-type cytochrome [Bryobacterales bacterium]|nr:c-type cytochrome [Bryobacterales bacterium]
MEIAGKPLTLERLTALLLLAFAACSSPQGPPYAARDAAETFELHTDFAIELFAAEPDIADPVALEFDDKGRMWVVENSGYPLDVDGHRGRVKLLEDTNGDGRPDKTTLFADKLTLPTGVMAWKRGVIVTDAPDVLYLEDSDGDGRADVREVLLTGFAFTNPQHTVSSPVYGLDNWIYLSHEGYTRAVVFSKEFGDPGSEIHFADLAGGPRVPVDRRSVRFKPDSHELELLAGPSQFGMAFDERGAVFSHNNSNHARHEVIAARYLERNPLLRLAQPYEDIFEEGNPAKVFPITLNPRFEMLSGVGQMTSACGLTRYLGGAFPGYEDTAFVAEPTHNLVHADRWSLQGSTYVAKRLEPADKEFLASRDAWFRPVNFTIGPDGALYVVDYYREVIEHPEWTSSETYESEILYHGDDRGRIWRITPKGGLPFVKVDFASMTTAELVSELESANIWRRRTAQRLLVERKDAAAAPLLRTQGGVHALWTLEGLGALTGEDVARALASADPAVRQNAILLAEPRLKVEPALAKSVLGLAADSDPHVRFQALLTLGELDSADARQARDEALFAGIEDEWVQAAALTWADARPELLYAEAKRRLGDNPTVAQVAFFKRLAVMAGAARDRAAIAALLGSVRTDASAERQAAALEGLRAGLEGRGARKAVSDAERARVYELRESESPEVRAAAVDLLEEIGVGGGRAAAARTAQEAAKAAREDADPELRAQAIRLLATDQPERHRALFKKLAGPAEPEAVQAAAVRACGAIEADEPALELLGRLRELPGKARTEVAEAMLVNDRRALALVEALESSAVQPWMLSSRQKHRLIMYSDPALRARARKLLDAAEGDRRAVLDRYRVALERPGNSAQGQKVFERVCKKCHAMNEDGEDVGPDLATVSTRPAAAILSDILQPNESIAQTYESYVVETTDGEIHEGVIGPQGPTFVTLRREGGEEDVIERSRIGAMRAAQLSAMPGDLEQQVSVEEMADLLAFIRGAER